VPKRKEWYKDKQKYLLHKNRHRNKNYNKGFTTKAYKRWSWSEIAQILERKITDRELSFKIERSVQAIQHKRQRTKQSLWDYEKEKR